MSEPRRRAALALDILTAVFVALAIAIELTGGFMGSFGGLRISARSVDRAVLAAVALTLVRAAFDRRTRPFGMSDRRFGRLREQLFDRGADGPGSSRGGLVAAATGICAIAAVLLYPQLRQMYSVPDLGDPLFSMWRMGWVEQQLRGDPRPLFDGNIFHPEPLALTYSDSMLLVGAAYAGLRAVGLHPVLAYNVLFVASFVLSALAMYLLANRLTGSRAAAFVAAIVFGFYPYRFEHYSHLELQMTLWMPLALIALHRYLETGRWPYAAAGALAVTAQLYSSMYYGIYFSLYAAVIALVLWRFRSASSRRLLGPALAAGAVAILLAVPLARPYIAARGVKGDRGHDAVRMYSSQAVDYFRAHERSALYGPRLLPGVPERALFPGVLALALAGLALVPPLGVIRLAYAAGLLVAFDASLGFNGLLYPYFYDWLLPIRGMRVPARFSIIVGLTLAVLSAFGARRLLRRVDGRRGTIAFAVMVAAAVIDLWPSLKLQPVWRDRPAIYDSLRGSRDAVLAEFPLNHDPYGFADNTPFMYFSLWHWSPMVNGYSGFLPPSYQALVTRLPEFPNDDAVDLLRSRGVTHVSVNCVLLKGPCDALVHKLNGSSRFREVARADWQGQPAYLFEVIR